MLAATRLIALHKNKGMTVAACLKNRTDYIENPDKTEQGQYVSSYACSALTADEEFMLTKRQYDFVNGRRQKSDVIAYQIRQSFRPGEITAEEANKVGYELAMRFTKGKHAFVVATHTDRQHIHNHVIFNSTALDGTRKFRDFFFSALAVQRLSDLICLEHQLSVIEKKPYRERQKRIVYPPKESNRDRLCGIIDTILAEKPGDYEAFLQKLEQQGYEVKRGKHTAVKGKGQKRFIRFRTLGTGYGEEEIKAVLEGKAKYQPYQRKLPKEQPFQLLVDIQGKMAEGKSIRYTCYGKLRKQTDCTGQTGYTMHILDEIIDKMVRQIFSRLRGIPKEQLITSRYAKETAERKNHLQALQAERDKAEKDLLALKTEILAVIKGESAFPKDTLAEMIAAQEKKHTELETLCEEASAELERNAELMANVSQLYEELISYADLYDSASFEAKKMIVSQLIRRVEVYRGYQIHVDFNFDLAQYLENSDELAC